MMKSPFRCKVRCTGGFPYYNSPPGPASASHNEHHGEDYVPVDKSVESNWTLYSVCEGTVIRSNNNDDYGNCIVIARDDGYWVLYAHLKIRDIKLNQRVMAGQKIGVAGWSGNVKPSGAAGRHLHIEVVDMRGYAPKWNYKEHLKHLVKPSDYIDFSDYTPEPKKEFPMEWKNGSTRELVYQTTAACKKQGKDNIGSLAPRESCLCYGIVDGCYLVVYRVDGTTTYKTGFVKYSGGVKP